MHRSFQPILPCGNKYLQQKWDKTYYDEHKRKVQSAKPMVDTSRPPTYVHLNMKLKKLKLEEERLSVIERDNNLLLDKMSTIMRTKGRVDNKNDYEAKSLNKEKREQELLRVSKENHAILDRITKCEPQYQAEKWHEDWLKSEKYMDSIARYPRGWYIQQQKQSSQGRKSDRKDPKKEANEENAHGHSDNETESADESDRRKREKISKQKGQVVVKKKDVKVKSTKQSPAKIKKEEQNGKHNAAGPEEYEVVTDKEKEPVPDDMVEEEQLTADEKDDENLANNEAEQEYLTEQHEEYIEEDDKSDKEARSDSEAETEYEKDEAHGDEKKADAE
ncbi:uncharacterized protein CFAP97D2 [Pelodytes ibericus]